jgi:hypothetical protein
MAQLGRADVRDRLAWQHQVPALLAAYDRAVGETGAAPAPAPLVGAPA